MTARTTRHGAILVSLLLFGAGLSACSDDGASTRADTASGSANAGTGSGTGSATGSGSGLAAEDLNAISDDPLIAQAVADYQGYVRAEVDQLLIDTKAFT